MDKFQKKLWLATPTIHEDSLRYVTEAFRTNWMSTVGENIDSIEQQICQKVGCKYAVALASGTAAVHLAVKLAGVKAGDGVFCSDMTFAATVNPVVYEKANPIFIDTEYDTWNMDPEALEKAFQMHPDTKVILLANLYGTPAKFDEICNLAQKHGAVIVEDAAESLGAAYKGRQTGTLGKFSAISFNGNKIITGSSGGMLLTDDVSAAEKARKWSTQSRENAPWYQHEQVGYNYRMSNVIAGVVRGQIPYLEEHVAAKKAIYERYKEGFRDLPVTMNPYLSEIMEPNFWLSCLLIDRGAMCKQVRGDFDACYISEAGKTCPTEILEVLAEHNAEGRPLWKPLHMQPMFRSNPFITVAGSGRGQTNAYIPREWRDAGADIFHRGLCLPSDIKMTPWEQERVIEIVRSCFQ